MNTAVAMPSPRRSRCGVTLLLTLFMLALITIIVVGLLGTMTWEAAASRRTFDNDKARAFATLGMNSAVAQLRTALGPWDNPFVNFTNTAPQFYWSVSPGILTHWSYTQVAPLTNYPLFSIDPNGATNLVNLNAAAGDGTYPIAGGATPPNFSVYWVNVLRDPTKTAGTANPLIGRYAFWIDDENAKININTADGTLKYTTNSLGLGTPSEVDLRVLQQGGANLTTTEAQNIVYLARTTGYNSPREILRATNAAADLYSNNNFALTTWSRSPELNLFGESKIYCVPASTPGSSASKDRHNYLETNAITGQPLTEIYPTPGQLPTFTFKDPTYLGGSTQNNGWQPIVATQEWPIEQGFAHPYQGDRFGYQLARISYYLGGTNSMAKAINWPVFPYPSGSSTVSGSTGFVGKYSLRQLDCMALQMNDLTEKTITPEATNIDSNTLLTFSAPGVYPGILSHERVPGLARSPKINEILMQAQTWGASYINVNGTNVYTPPQLTMGIYLESYLPAGYGGVDLFNVSGAGLPNAPTYVTASDFYDYGVSSGIRCGELNIMEMPQGGVNPNTPPLPLTSANYSTYPRTPAFNAYADSSSPPFQTNGYWYDIAFRNNAGIDVFGNPPDQLDPDQVRAAIYHQSPYSSSNSVSFTTNSSGQFYGSGAQSGRFSPMLQMGSPAGPDSVGNGGATNVWYPGQYRVVVNGASQLGLRYSMVTNATSVTFSGGLIVSGYCRTGVTDPDPTPFESASRGIAPLPGTAGNYDGEVYTSNGTNTLAWPASTTPPYVGLPAAPNQTTYPTNPTETLISRVLNGVIPVNFTIAVPPLTTSVLATANSGSYHVEVADPLVNKFPGDWIASGTSANTMGGATPPTVGPRKSTSYGCGMGGYAVYYNGQNTSSTGTTSNSSYYDPDSFWLPPLDPNIPRSARFPSIGYFNFIRTGIIPDDETVAINLQHGTPYRCLNLSAINDASQTLAVAGTGKTTYPDWALLDLFTVPSTLLPYNGPYGYYNASGVWTAGSLLKGDPNNLYNYGTWGGSTPGRINPNGSVVYTTNVATPTPGIVRTQPLQALLHGLYVNQTIATGISAATATTNAPTYTAGQVVDDTTVAAAIQAYISKYGPLREPAEICNIPALSAYSATATSPGGDAQHNNPTRNDLIRQTVGNLTTQSNVFSVWVEGQSILKSKLNNNAANQGIIEPGDQITGTVRYHFVVERYFDMGADGIVGNAVATTGGGYTGPTSGNATADVDSIRGTYDDPVNAIYHPSAPRYLYRVLYSEEIRD